MYVTRTGGGYDALAKKKTERPGHCGPVAMLRAVAKIARHYRIQTQASLEERMGCGVGACLGCVVKTKAGYKRVCKDGPVFDLEDIVWE